MTTTACKSLADHLARKREKGLVDIKFFVHNQGEASLAKSGAEALALFGAIEAGEVEDFSFNDRHLMGARA